MCFETLSQHPYSYLSIEDSSRGYHNIPISTIHHLRAAIQLVGTETKREKVVVLTELQRAIIYTRELSQQAIEGHVSTAFIVY
jgi:hypothetical protein